VPAVVVSGRLSDRSFPRYRRLAFWLGRTLRRLHAIGARTDLDRERFLALGADPERVAVTGDLKLDPPDAAPEPSPALAAWLGTAPLVVGGSTHPGEEAALLDAMAGWEREGLQAALLLAPRYPERAREVAALVSGRRVSLRGVPGEAPLRAGDVGILDTLGELSGVYARARIAFVGGTLAPVGGHNVLEPVTVGTPVLHGPHVANARHAAELVAKVGAGERVADATALASALRAALADPEAAHTRGAAGRAALEDHRGASARSAALVEEALASHGGAARHVAGED
jgi:3-deoxy-D-manno-octulosonic-acid transferase